MKRLLQITAITFFAIAASGCVPLAIGAGAGIGYELAK